MKKITIVLLLWSITMVLWSLLIVRVDLSIYIFDMKKESLESELKILNEGISNTNDNRKKKIELVEDMFHFVSEARKSFKEWDYQTKKTIFRSLGLNFTLMDWVLAIELYPWLQVIKDNEHIVTRKKWRFAPTKNSISLSETNAINSSIPVWQGP